MLFRALEVKGRTIAKELPGEGAGPKRLNAVLEAARGLRAKLGRTPTRAELAETTGLSEDEIQHALALAQVMQR
ncbi:MAG TPA: sigma-70 domain-containing protein [Polyangiaceae bacterium]